MKPKFVLSGLCALTLAALAAIVLASHHHQKPLAALAGAQRFEVRGQIRNIDAANKTVRITHEEIPNYMPAMTMPFSVKDAALLNGLAAGETVQFQLTVTEEDSWITRIEKVPGPTPSDSARAGGSPASLEEREAERVQVGELVPDFKLIDQDGQPVRLSALRGKAVILTFIYTRCPLPNFCPLMSRNFAELEKRLNKEVPGQYRLLSVTMDPEFDTPAVLKEYASRYEANTANWSFATGEPGAIESVARLMGLYYARENGLISHDLRTALIGPNGRLVHIWKGNAWTPYEIQRMAHETLTPAKTVAVR